jgi:hypothetical protein
MPDTPDTARDKMVAAYALRCASEQDLVVFKEYLDEYSRQLIAAAVADLLEYLGMGDGVEVEVVHLTEEQRRKLEESGKLDDYLTDKGKDDCDG